MSAQQKQPITLTNKQETSLDGRSQKSFITLSVPRNTSDNVVALKRRSGFKRDAAALTLFACAAGFSVPTFSVSRNLDAFPEITQTFNPHNRNSEVTVFLARFYSELNRDTSLEVNMHLVSFVRNAARAGEYKLIDQLMASIKLDRLSNVGAIALVRTTFQARQRISRWGHCLAQVESLLAERGADSKQLLRGLAK